jgi:hypothetical protein
MEKYQQSDKYFMMTKLHPNAEEVSAAEFTK